MEDCIFCKIVKGEMESEKIYETDNVISFLDKFPRAPGHALVIPKKHEQSLADIDDDLACEVFGVAKKVEEMLEDALNPDAYTIGINDGEAAGQEIPHLHINIFPRFEDDGGEAIHSVVDNPPEEDVYQIAERVREAK